MGRSSMPALRKEFWDINRHLLNVEVSGKLEFTDEGKRQYRPLLARHGFSLANIATLDDLRRVMRDVEALQKAENLMTLRARLHHPTTAAVERAMLAKLVGSAPAPAPPCRTGPGAKVVSLAAWRQRTAS